jgi:hypothetical protein
MVVVLEYIALHIQRVVLTATLLMMVHHIHNSMTIVLLFSIIHKATIITMGMLMEVRKD